MPKSMSRGDALKMALSILKPFCESSFYEQYQKDEGFTDDEYEAMLQRLYDLW